MKLLVVVAAAVLCFGCVTGTGGDAGAGGGGGEGGSGGTLSPGGADGEGGFPNKGGSGGSGGVGGGGGDPRGDGGITWLNDSEVWELIELKEQPRTFRIYRGDPAQMQFPAPSWEDCGYGCEAADLQFAFITGDTIIGTLADEGDSRGAAHAGVVHFDETGHNLYHRLVRLSDGVTVRALRFSQTEEMDERTILVGTRREGPNVILVLERDTPGQLWASFGQQGGWDFKEPRQEIAHFSTMCRNFGLPSSPPAYLFGCRSGLHVMKHEGSSEFTTFPGSERTAVGTAGNGKAIWAQHMSEEGKGLFSRILSWAPGEEVEIIADLPGDVCGLAVGPDHIAGFRGDRAAGSSLCFGGVTPPRFFWIKGEEREVQEGPVFPLDWMSVGPMATTAEFTAAKTSMDPYSVEMTQVTLIRHSDGKMRQFMIPPTGYTLGRTTVALDDEYLYYTLWNSKVGDWSFDRVYRYRLDLFDEIGIPYPPEGE